MAPMPRRSAGAERVRARARPGAAAPAPSSPLRSRPPRRPRCRVGSERAGAQCSRLHTRRVSEAPAGGHKGCPRTARATRATVARCSCAPCGRRGAGQARASTERAPRCGCGGRDGVTSSGRAQWWRQLRTAPTARVRRQCMGRRRAPPSSCAAAGNRDRGARCRAVRRRRRGRGSTAHHPTPGSGRGRRTAAPPAPAGRQRVDAAGAR
jgi:hypothetical protein